MLAAALLLAMAAALPGLAQAGGFKLGNLFKMSLSQEEEIASELHDELAEDPGLITEGERYDLVQEIGARLVEKNNLDEYEYKFFLVKDEEVNAFATPAGYIYVTEGLLDYMAYDESMLAGVMAHELGHAKDRHVAKGYEKAMTGVLGLTVLDIALGKKNEDITNAVAVGGQVIYLKYNRDQEEWADRYGVDLAYNAGYDAYGLVRGLECLEALHGSADDISVWLQNHPSTDDRVDRTLKIAAETCGQPHGYMKIPAPPKDHPLYEKYGPEGSGPDQAVTGAIGEAEVYVRPRSSTSRSTPQVR